MAKIVKKLTDLVGNTPLMELSGYCGKYGMEQNIIAKLEAFNPAGSVKDRVALSMIEDAEARGVLKPGATIIEPTSGNTGVGLAMVSTIKGYHLILTMPETMSLERRNLLKALGAQIVLTDGLGGMAASIAKAEELRDSIPGDFTAIRESGQCRRSRTDDRRGNMERYGRRSRGFCGGSWYGRNDLRCSPCIEEA